MTPAAATPGDVRGLPARIGRYQVRAIAGIGGFATVAHAHDEVLDVEVAIKVLHDAVAFDPDVRDRFVHEARLLRRVRSTNVVDVFDIGELDDARPYFVMPLAVATLAERLERRPVADRRGDDLASLVHVLADGVGALHEAGIVHRDLKPANLLVLAAPGGPVIALASRPGVLAPGERLVIGDLGLAKDLRAEAWGPTILGGTPAYRAPEQAEIGATIRPAADVHAATAIVFEAVTGAPPDADRLEVAIAGAPPAWQAFVRSGLDPDADRRIGEMATWRTMAIAALDQIAPPQSSPASVSTTRLATGDVCPYKGLAAFQADDAALFFGRNRLVDELVARLQTADVLVVAGPSGSGKSSVVRAGLLPALADGALAGSSHWHRAVMHPGRDPMRTFVAITKDRRSDERSVIVVDQFEEVFTLAPVEEREAFLAELARVSAWGSTRLVLVVRADFYDQCGRVPWLASAISDHHVLVSPLGRSGLREAIEGPARRVGLRLEPGLVDLLVDDGVEAAADQAALPLVSHALVETWLRRRDGVLTIDGYRQAGGVAGALARRADAVIDGLAEEHRVEARRILLALVTPGDGTPDTRRRIAWQELDDGAAVREIVGRLVDARLLTVDAQSVEIAHESLIRTWPRLATWIEDERDQLRLRQRLVAIARDWERTGRDREVLPRGATLAAAMEMGQGPTSAAVNEMLDAALVEERRRGRVRRRAVVALTALTVVAMVASAVALASLARSRRNENRARDAAVLAEDRFARSLAVTAAGLAANGDPLLATNLALESDARGGGPEARDALVRARLALAEQTLSPAGDPIAVGDGLSVALSRSGDRLVVGRRDGTIAVWDVASRSLVAEMPGAVAGVQALVLSPDGATALAGGVDGTVWRWDIADPTAVPSALVTVGDVVWGLALSPDGATLAIASQDGTVRLVDAASGAALGEPLLRRQGDVLSVAFSDDGSRVVAGDGGGTMWAWRVADVSAEPMTVRSGGSDVWEVAFLRDGTALARSSDGAVRTVDIDAGIAGGLLFDAPDVSSAGVSVAGTTVVVGGSDGSLRTIDTTDDGDGATTLVRHDAAVIDTAVTADGALVASLANDQTVQLWSTQTVPVLHDVTALGRPAFSVDARDGRIAIGGEDGSVRVVGDGEAFDLPGGGARVFALALTQDGRLVSGDRSGTVRMWNLATRGLIAQRQVHTGEVTGIAIDPRGSVVSVGQDGAVVSSAPGDLAERARHEPGLGALTSIAITDDRAVAGTATGSVLTLQIDEALISAYGEPITVSPGTAVWSVAAAGNRVVAGSDDGSVTVWELGVAAPIARVASLGGGATDVAIGNDDVVVASSRDGDVLAWNVTDGDGARQLGPAIAVSTEAVWGIAVMDGSVVAASTDGRVRLVDALDADVACASARWAFDVAQIRRHLGGAHAESCR
jgi:WD40 repeat protein